MKMTFTETECYVLADCAARSLRDAHGIRRATDELEWLVRRNLMAFPVAACRALWRVGTPEARAQLAARIHCWLKKDGRGIYERFIVRERKRRRP